MNPIRLSIVIPCFNDGLFLREAVDSVLRHPGQNYEIVVVNDGSTDSTTLEVMQALPADRVRLLHQSNQGLAAARNAGIAAARAPYILPLDADNRIAPAYIDRGVQVLEAEPRCDVVYGDHAFFGEREGLVSPGKFDLERLLSWNYIDACAVVRKAAWERCGGYDENMPSPGFEDWDLWCRIACSGGEFHYIPEVLFEYRVRPGQMSATMATREKVEAIVQHMRRKPVTIPLGTLLDAYKSRVAVWQRIKYRPLRTLARLLWEAFHFTGSK